MSDDLLDAWLLFRDAWLTGLATVGTLATVGVWMVGRGQVFAGLAISQASLLGVAIALACGVAASGVDAAATVTALITGIGAALAMALGRSAAARDALAGWVVLTAGACSILVMARSPHGLDDLRALQSSSIIGADGGEALIAGALLLATLVGTVIARDRLIACLLDPVAAAAHGLHPRWVTIVVTVWTALAVAFAMRTAGALVAAGALVLPALAAAGWCRDLRSLFIVSPAVAMALFALSALASHRADLPPGQVFVALGALLAAIGAVMNRVARR